ncbi:hypothetical protein XELAEV_18031469mg [Xenopus laevis]|uniref:Reverse transcriptase domain-containing protein n=1 Tax=Xenopus laevis TaxID=8355 RepID=A0A974CMN4_XENLA|nr:hypothetical protein XELAEV_18031469mg [Xenopus laevis]
MNINVNISGSLLRKLNIKRPKSHLTYLGLAIPSDLGKLYALNFPPAINNVLSLCNKWLNAHFNLKGKIALFKMLIFPKPIYPLVNLPLLLKHTDIKKLDSSLNSLIWGSKKPKIALSKLRCTSEQGGLKVTDFRAFNLASITRYLIEWIYGGKRFTNPELEIFHENNLNILTVAHTKWKDVHITFKTNPLFRDSLSTWKLLFSSHNLNHMQNPFMPLQLLWRNSKMGYPSLLPNKKNNLPLLMEDVVDPANGNLLKWPEFRSNNNLKPGDYSMYMFIKSSLVGAQNKESYVLQKYWLTSSMNVILENPDLMNIDLISQIFWSPGKMVWLLTICNYSFPSLKFH